MRPSVETAETLALQALTWLVGNDELLPVFLGSTGADVADLKTRATEPEFLRSVLEFLTMDDAWIVAFCDASNTPYEQPMMARSVLAGGEDMHWT